MVEEQNLVLNTQSPNQKQYFPPSFKDQLKELGTKFLGFIFAPGKKNSEILERDFELNKNKSKRSIIRKLNAPLTIVGILILFVVISWAVFAPWISSDTFQSANGIFSNVYAPPSPAHPLGTTDFGQDVYSRLIWGARSSLTLGLAAISISCVCGVALGLIAAFSGGWLDSLIMRITDIFLAFPSLILVLVVISVVGSHTLPIISTFGILGIPGYARLIRGIALQETNRPYVQSAIVSGTSNPRIIFKHILPNCIAPIIVTFTFDLGGIILSLAGLGFLGFGDPSLIEWGNDISIAQPYLYNAPWAALWPGVAILVSVLAFMLVGDGLRDALDPRLKI